MSSTLRNRLALVIFFLLMALGGLCIVIYIVVGHGWNYAATEIDDTSGNMQEYLVVVFNGTSKVSDSQQRVSSTSQKSQGNVSSNTNNTSASSGSSGSSQEGIGQRIQKFFNLDTSTDATEEQKDEIDDNPVITNNPPSTFTLGDVYASYIEKGADVLSVYSRDVEHYADGEIFYKGSYIVGVLGLSEIESYKTVQAKIDNLKARGATCVIVLAARTSMLAATHGADVCIEVNGTTQSLESSVSGGVVSVKSSVQGSVDAVIFSPNHIVSAKMI